MRFDEAHDSEFYVLCDETSTLLEGLSWSCVACRLSLSSSILRRPGRDQVISGAHSDAAANSTSQVHCKSGQSVPVTDRCCSR